MVLAANPRASLEGQHFHVVVIGGGINGVAVARECARAGNTRYWLSRTILPQG